MTLWEYDFATKINKNVNVSARFITNTFLFLEVKQILRWCLYLFCYIAIGNVIFFNNLISSERYGIAK